MYSLTDPWAAARGSRRIARRPRLDDSPSLADPVDGALGLDTRYGASAVFDPWTQAAYVVGGTQEDATVVKVASPWNEVVPNAGSNFAVTEADLSYTLTDPAAGTWDELTTLLSPALGTSSDAVEVALLAEQRGLGEQIAAYGVEAGDRPPTADLAVNAPPTWLLRCAAGSLDPRCALDTDGDGAPDAGDCDPLLSGIHPEVQDPLSGLPWQGGDADLDCDGWPNAGFFP